MIDTSENHSKRRLIITVHGIRTFGGWQERLEKMVKEESKPNSVQFLNYKYGYFSVFAFIIPLLRWLVVRNFREELIAWCNKEEWDRIDLVGHSFGTHVLAWALHGLPVTKRPSIHTILLSGSVLRGSFPWRDLVGRNVKRVVNDCGSKDTILVINQLFILFTGMAGRAGFSGATHNKFRNRFFVFGHSGYFVDQNNKPDNSWMKAYWIPALIGNEGIAPHDDRSPPSLIDGLVHTIANNAEPIKLAIYLLPMIAIGGWIWQLYQGEIKANKEANYRLALLSIGTASTQRLAGRTDEALLLLLNAAKSFDTTNVPDRLLIELQKAIEIANRQTKFTFSRDAIFFKGDNDGIVFDPSKKSIFKIKDYKNQETLIKYDKKIIESKINKKTITFIEEDLTVRTFKISNGKELYKFTPTKNQKKLLDPLKDRTIFSDGVVIFNNTRSHQGDENQQLKNIVIDAKSGNFIRTTIPAENFLQLIDDGNEKRVFFSPDPNLFYLIDREANKLVTASLDNSNWANFYLCENQHHEIPTSLKTHFSEIRPWITFPIDGNFCIKRTEQSLLFQSFQFTSAGGNHNYYFVGPDFPERQHLVEILANLPSGTNSDKPIYGVHLDSVDFVENHKTNTTRFLVNHNKTIFIFRPGKLLLQIKTTNPAETSGFINAKKIYHVEKSRGKTSLIITEIDQKKPFHAMFKKDKSSENGNLNFGNCTTYKKSNTIIKENKISITLQTGNSHPDRIIIRKNNQEIANIEIESEFISCIQFNKIKNRLLTVLDDKIEIYDIEKLISKSMKSEALIGRITHRTLGSTAFFYGNTNEIITSHTDNRVLLWSEDKSTDSKNYSSVELANFDFPINYAEPNSDGSALLLLKNLPAADEEALLYSLSADTEWTSLTTGYKWVQVAFDLNDNVIFSSPDGLLAHQIQHFMIPSLEVYKSTATKLISRECQPPIKDDYLSSPCWPDLKTALK